MTFGEALKTLRELHGLTQDELSKATGLTRSAIGMYESGSREPKFEILELLADYFNVDMNTLHGVPPRDSDFDFTSNEIEMIKKYRQLPASGRRRVDFTLDREYEFMLEDLKGDEGHATG